MELTKAEEQILHYLWKLGEATGHPFMYGRNGKAFPYHGIYNHSYS